MMARLGIDTEEYFEADDFRDVTNFNTQETLNALGIATSDIAEMGLSEISNRQNSFRFCFRLYCTQSHSFYQMCDFLYPKP